MISLYTADYVVTQNDARDIIRNAAVAVEDGRILSVGHTDLLEILFPECRRVDLGHAVIMPGLINAHTHVSMSLLRGYSDDKALMDWLTQDIFPAEAKLTPELVELGAMFWVGKPYLFRDWASWLVQRPALVSGLAVFNFVYGLAICTCAGLFW